MKNAKMIGIAGGMGPYASLDLLQKILDHTIANEDQNHLPVVLISAPDIISDRTEFLMGKTSINPAYAISEIISRLIDVGADVIGIPCNTAHAPPIYNVIVEVLNGRNKVVKIIHMIDEVVEFMRQNDPILNNIGILCTTGTSMVKIYPTALAEKGYKVIMPDKSIQESTHLAIYNKKYGIKARSNPVTEEAKDHVIRAINHLKEKGANALVLGCSEITFALREQNIGSIPVIDPVLVLARALIRELDPDKLKPLQGSIL